MAKLNERNNFKLSISLSLFLHVRPIVFSYEHENHLWSHRTQKKRFLLYIDKFSVEREPKLNDILLVRYKLINKYHESCTTKINTFKPSRVEKPHARFICIGSKGSKFIVNGKKRSEQKTYIYKYFYMQTHSWNGIAWIEQLNRKRVCVVYFNRNFDPSSMYYDF